MNTNEQVKRTKKQKYMCVSFSEVEAFERALHDTLKEFCSDNNTNCASFVRQAIAEKLQRNNCLVTA